MCEFCKTHLTAYLREDTGYGVWHLWLRPHRAYNVRLLKPHVGNVRIIKAAIMAVMV